MNIEILNKYVELINKGYCDDCNELNCIGNFPHKEIAKNIKIILEENQELKKQLEYLRSGEYLNQLKFERNMLQDVVDDMEVAPEDKAFIDCTHRNTELLEENQRLKNQLEEWEQYLINAKEMLNLQGHDGNYNYDNYMLGLYNGIEYVIALFEKRNPIYKDGKNIEFLNDKNQQKEFIEWLEKMIKDMFKKEEYEIGAVYCYILEKYKEIIGDNNK